MDASARCRSIGSTRQVAQLRAAIYTKSYSLRGDARRYLCSLLGSGTFANRSKNRKVTKIRDYIDTQALARASRMGASGLP
jgi:hypothetical protein